MQSIEETQTRTFNLEKNSTPIYLIWGLTFAVIFTISISHVAFPGVPVEILLVSIAVVFGTISMAPLIADMRLNGSSNISYWLFAISGLTLILPLSAIYARYTTFLLILVLGTLLLAWDLIGVRYNNAIPYLGALGIILLSILPMMLFPELFLTTLALMVGVGIAAIGLTVRMLSKGEPYWGWPILLGIVINYIILAGG